jgi:DNA-binding CsgD family transcriptional regulator
LLLSVTTVDLNPLAADVKIIDKASSELIKFATIGLLRAIHATWVTVSAGRDQYAVGSEPGKASEMTNQEQKWIEIALQSISTLSPQQLVVLRCLAAGMDNRSIAEIMGRSERTIKAHVSALIERLHVESRLQLGLVGYHVVLLANPHLLAEVDGHVPDVLAHESLRALPGFHV